MMALTLDPNGYKWDFESALAGPTGLVQSMVLHFLRRLRMVFIATRASAPATVVTLPASLVATLVTTLVATRVITITRSSSPGCL